jgi:hypothetical protein
VVGECWSLEAAAASVNCGLLLLLLLQQRRRVISLRICFPLGPMTERPNAYLFFSLARFENFF